MSFIAYWMNSSFHGLEGAVLRCRSHDVSTDKTLPVHSDSKWVLALFPSYSFTCRHWCSQSSPPESSPRSCCGWTAYPDRRSSPWSARPHTVPWAEPRGPGPSIRWWWRTPKPHPVRRYICVIVFQYRHKPKQSYKYCSFTYLAEQGSSLWHVQFGLALLFVGWSMFM